MDQKTERLLDWYDRNARSMPWRGERDPYRIWVSEIMLQQTRVETVTGYYDRFLRTFPTLRSLAEAAEEDVLKQWEGLGYYSRARNLRSGAEQVLREYGGRIPSDPAELRRIRGIGAYTAAAVASIAFGVRAAAVDGNVVRVISRLYGVEEDVTEREVRRRVERLADGLTPPERPGDHNQAMMDLGATVCVPGTPDCGTCPLRGLCEAEAAADGEAAGGDVVLSDGGRAENPGGKSRGNPEEMGMAAGEDALPRRGEAYFHPSDLADGPVRGGSSAGKRGAGRL